jgi:transposase InsO family protein
MYLKGPKCLFFDQTLELVGLEAGDNGLRPSLRKRKMILEWPTPESWDDVMAFCYLTPFLRRFIPGRAELVRIMKKGMEVEIDEENEGGDLERKEPGEWEEDNGNKKVRRKKAKKPRKMLGPFRWTEEQNCAFQTIKNAIAMNAMASPDTDQQYHLAVDASKRGIGGVLFQLEGIAPHSEANGSQAHRESERMIMFISFKLEDAETRYSNSEREALAVIRCMAEVRWMVISSPYPILVYTDHEALRVLLTGMDNDAHGRIAKWQERLGEYNFRLIHRACSVNFMGIADGLSRLPSALMQKPFVEDSDGLRPRPGIVSAGQSGIDIAVPVTAMIARYLRTTRATKAKEKVENHGGKGRIREGREGERGGVAVFVLLGSEGQEETDVEREGRERLGIGARELKRRKWKRWIESGFYGEVVRLKMEGIRIREELDLGRGEWRSLENRARRYVMLEGQEARLAWKERDGQLAFCVLEEEVERVLWELHEGHGHFAAGLTAGRAHGRYFWPTRQRDIGRWVASCEPCQRMTRIQRSGQPRSILQLAPMDMVGMDFVGPINPPCEATGAVYILLVVDYFSRFVFGAALQRADQLSTMQVFVDRVVPVVGWPRSVYSDNGTHFTGSAIKKMWNDHGVAHFTAAISHPQSVGLSERYVQMTMGRIRLKCITMGSSANWGLLVKDAVIDINTRCVRIHGYTPAEILLGFNPVTSHQSVITGENRIVRGDALEDHTPEEDTIHVHTDTRDERGMTATQKLARNQDSLTVQPSRGYKRPEVGDLVLVRDIQLAKEKGKKLEPRWSTPRILEKVSKSGVSGHIRQLHDPPGKTKRYHMDDLIPYVARSQETFPGTTNVAAPAIEYTRDALGSVQGNWSVGQRAFDLGDVRGSRRE